jgi:HEAT repeat protein
MGESIGVQMAAVNRVVDQLATILSDETRSSDERIQAAIQIERAGTPQALAFLVKNIGLQVPVRMIARENDRVRRYPCYYALTGMDSRRANWAAVPLLIEHASAITAAESQELSVVASCLVCICGRRAAIEIVTSRIQSTSGENGKRGLDSLRRVLQQ